MASENCLQRAHTWHRRLCRLLLVAQRGLRTYYAALLEEAPQLQPAPLDRGGCDWLCVFVGLLLFCGLIRTMWLGADTLMYLLCVYVLVYHENNNFYF